MKMAHDYFRGESSEPGSVHIAYSVIEHIARIGIDDMEGVVIADGSFKKGINASEDKGLTKVNVDIKVKYGFNADRIARQIQDVIIKDVRQMADVIVENVDVNVLGFHF